MCVALDTATKHAGNSRVVHEFRREAYGYSVLTFPERGMTTDGDLTVRLSPDFKVLGFGPDSA